MEISNDPLLKFVVTQTESPTDETFSFPLDVFPDIVKNIIVEAKECLSYPIDYTAASMLFAVSVAIGNSIRVQVKNQWIESAVLYIALVGDRGVSKTHPLSFAIKPIQAIDRLHYKEYQSKLQEYEIAASLPKTEREQQGIELIKPHCKTHFVSDITNEALMIVHKNNPRGLGVYVDELGSWFGNFNRYSKGSEEQFWLSAWNAKPISVDRKTSGTIRIDLPFVSVCGTIQTDVLQSLTDGRIVNGFTDRILFVSPKAKKEYISDKEISQQSIEHWYDILSNIMRHEYNEDQQKILSFSREAYEMFIAWQKVNTDESNITDDAIVKGINAKMDYYVIRFSLILQVLRAASYSGTLDCIEPQSVKGAIRMVNYFKHNANRVHDVVANINPLSRLTDTKRNLYTILGQSFSKQDAKETASMIGMNPRTLDRFLNDSTLFKRKEHGEYEKLL